MNIGLFGSAMFLVITGAACAGPVTTVNWVNVRETPSVNEPVLPAADRRYISLKLEGVQINAHANMWTRFLSSKTNVVVKVAIPLSSYDGAPATPAAVTTPAVKIDYNNTQQLAQNLALLTKVPTQTAPIMVQSSVVRTAEDGVAAAMTQLSAQATSLGLGAASATPIAALGVVKTLVDEIVRKDLTAEMMPSTYTIDSNTKPGYYVVLSADTDDNGQKKEYDRILANPAALDWNGTSLGFQPSAGAARERLQQITYLVFSVRYLKTFYADESAIIDSATPYGILYQNIRTMIDAQVSEFFVVGGGAAPSAAALDQDRVALWKSMQPLFESSRQSIQRDMRLSPEDRAQYNDKVRNFLAKYLVTKFRNAAIGIWESDIAGTDKTPEAKTDFVNSVLGRVVPNEPVFRNLGLVPTVRKVPTSVLDTHKLNLQGLNRK